jgi:hypothetical protein
MFVHFLLVAMATAPFVFWAFWLKSNKNSANLPYFCQLIAVIWNTLFQIQLLYDKDLLLYFMKKVKKYL